MSFKKMALVPFDMVGKMNDLNTLKVPNETQVVKNFENMSNVLEDETLTDNQKMNRYNEELNDYNVFANKVVNPSLHTATVPLKPKEDTFNAIPKSFQKNANALMEELKKYPQIIQWNPINHEVAINGKPLRGSNIIDLIGHVMRSRKTTKDPVHGDAFLKKLANLNIPEELVKNKYQISKFRSYKNVESDEEVTFQKQQVNRAQQQLAGRKRRDPGKKISWLNTYK
jgi:hypothetical protein